MTEENDYTNKNQNIQVKGKNNIINVSMIESRSSVMGKNKDFFNNIDEEFRRIIGKETVLRLGKEEPFSSKKIFESLVRVGIGYDFAKKILEQMILKIEMEGDWEHLDTKFIRNIISECILELGEIEDFNDEKGVILLWRAAYIRRYGSPDSKIRVKMIEAQDGLEVFNYKFIQNILIPDILKKILGVELDEEIRKVFSKERVESLSRQIYYIVENLNVYTVRYSTIKKLIEDILIEPPHPIIVSPESRDSIIKYNLEKCAFHKNRIEKFIRDGNIKYAATFYLKEYAMHLFAAILSKYNYFLGIDRKYGFIEMCRLIDNGIYDANLWPSCRICKLTSDLKRIGLDIKTYRKKLTKLYLKINNIIYGNDNGFEKDFQECVDMLEDHYDIMEKIISLTCDHEKV